MDNLLSVDGPGGRTLAVTEYGDPDGTPVLSLHGTPGSRLRIPPNVADVRTAGLRVITYDRPGYGGSDRQAGRRIVDCVADGVAIADALGLDRFHVAGGSGGAPHALALAARLPERVASVEALVSPAPWDAEGLDWFAGMDPENVAEYEWALAGEHRLHQALTLETAEMLRRMDEDEADAIGDLDLGEADQ